MKVIDSCRCGASVTIEDAANAGSRHDQWLKAHADCRKAPAIQPPHFPPSITQPTMPWMPDRIINTPPTLTACTDTACPQGCEHGTVPSNVVALTFHAVA